MSETGKSVEGSAVAKPQANEGDEKARKIASLKGSVRLISQEGDSFEIPKKVACLSDLLYNMCTSLDPDGDSNNDDDEEDGGKFFFA